jgi:hypothetical protein
MPYWHISTQEKSSGDSSQSVRESQYAWSVSTGIFSSMPCILTLTKQDSPSSFAEMQGRPDAVQWQQAADEEIQALTQLGVFEVVRRPVGVKPLTSKWVFDLWRNKGGIIQRYRARLVARGYKQRHGIDYDELFAPVAKQRQRDCCWLVLLLMTLKLSK